MVIYGDQMRSELKGSSRTKQRGSVLFCISLLKGMNELWRGPTLSAYTIPCPIHIGTVEILR